MLYNNTMALSSIFLLYFIILGQTQAPIYEKALRLENSGDLTGAMVLYEEVLEKDPMHEKAIIRVSELYVISNACYRATMILPSLMRLNPSLAQGWYALAFCFDKQGLNKKSLKAASRYIRLLPSDPKGIFMMAKILEHSGFYKQAIIYYKRLLAMGAKQFIKDAQKAISRLSVKSDDKESFIKDMYTKAIKALNKQDRQSATIAALRGLSSQIHRGLLIILSRTAPPDNCVRSLNFLRKGAYLFPDESEILFAYAYCSRITGNFLEALRSYRNYVVSFPKDPDGWFGMGETYRLMGRYGSAILSYKEYLKKEHRKGQEKWIKQARLRIKELRRLASHMAVERRELSIAKKFINKMKYVQAIKIIKKYTKKYPWDPIGYLLLSDVYIKNGDLKKAEKFLKKVEIIEPENPLLYKSYGDFYVRLRYKEKAIKAYKMYLALTLNKQYKKQRERVRNIIKALEGDD